MVDIENPDPQQFPLFSSAERYEADLGPGDVLFIPALWFHNMLGQLSVQPWTSLMTTKTF